MGVSHTQWPSSVTRAILACLWFAQGLHKAQKNKTAEPFYNVQGDSMCSILPIDATSFFSTSLKGIIRKECQSFTNHGHAKTPPAVFNPLSLWLTLPRDMGVSHTQWPSSVTRAILACLWFAQGLHKAQKNKTAEPFYNVQGDSMYSILSIDATYFFNITK